MGDLNFGDAAHLTPTQVVLPVIPEGKEEEEEIDLEFMDLEDVIDFGDEEKPGAYAGRKFRIFHIRINELTGEELIQLQEILVPACREVIIGAEEYGKSRACRHHHLHVHFKYQLTVSGVVKLLRPILSKRSTYRQEFYIAPAKCYDDNTKTEQDNREYCTKKGTVFEYSTMHASKRAAPSMEADIDDETWLNQIKLDKLRNEDVNSIQAIAKNIRHEWARKTLGYPEKASMLSLYEAMHKQYGHLAGLAFFPDVYYQASGNNVRKLNVSKIGMEFPSSDEQEIIWITGTAGTGKTSFTNALYPGHYVKNKDTPFWESYRFLDHSTNNPDMCVVFNELDLVSDLQAFSANQTSFDAIKMILDVNPFPIEIKHKNQEMIRPRRIFITSNTSLEALKFSAWSIARHDNSSNKLFGLDVDCLFAALGRRVKTIPIEELLETYGLFCLPKLPHLPVGGVFPKRDKSTMLTELSNLVLTYEDPIELHEMSSAFRKRWENTTREYLRQFRWRPYDLVKSVNSRTFDRQQILASLASLV